MEANKNQYWRTKLLFQSCPERRVMRNKELMFKRPFEAIDGEFLADLGRPDWVGISQERRPSPAPPWGTHMPVPKSDP